MPAWPALGSRVWTVWLGPRLLTPHSAPRWGQRVSAGDTVTWSQQATLSRALGRVEIHLAPWKCLSLLFNILNRPQAGFGFVTQGNAVLHIPEVPVKQPWKWEGFPGCRGRNFSFGIHVSIYTSLLNTRGGACRSRHQGQTTERGIPESRTRSRGMRTAERPGSWGLVPVLCPCSRGLFL